MKTRTAKTHKAPPAPDPMEAAPWLDAMTRAGQAWVKGAQDFDRSMIDYIQDSVDQAESCATRMMAARDPETLATLCWEFTMTKWLTMTDQTLALARIGLQTGEAMSRPMKETFGPLGKPSA